MIHEMRRFVDLWTMGVESASHRKRIPARIIRVVGEAVFPTKCAVCRSFITPAKDSAPSLGPEATRRWVDSHLSSFVCSSCRKGIISITPPVCKSCGAVFQTSEGEDHLCESCIVSSKHFYRARSSGLYDQTLMALIHQFKYQGNIRLARPLGVMVLDTYLHFFSPENIDMIVPVPLHAKRFRQRGFNQAYLLVKDWRRFTPTLPAVEKDVLFRIRWTDPQTGLGRKERERNIKQAFSVDGFHKIQGKKILLVDDVYTTGATVNECARVLRAAGAERVDVLTLARAQ